MLENRSLSRAIPESRAIILSKTWYSKHTNLQVSNGFLIAAPEIFSGTVSVLKTRIMGSDIMLRIAISWAQT